MRGKTSSSLVSRGALITLVVAGCMPLAAQTNTRGGDVAGPGESQFDIQVLRPSGGPIIPMFEGWYQNLDGTYELLFGYFTANTEEYVDIPLGPDNFIAPAEFDGVQPTHFPPVPDEDRRHYGVFTVTVPEDFGSQDLVWTLRVPGRFPPQERFYSVPGRITRTTYQLIPGLLANPGQETVAPVIQFDVAGEEVRGAKGISVGPLEATVGTSLPLNVWISRNNPFRDDTRPVNLRWSKYQGPGDVAFRQATHRVRPEAWTESESGAGQVTTAATFSEPGEYVLRVIAFQTPNELRYFCCWTNGFVRVSVSESE